MTQKLKYLCIVMTLLGLLMIGGCSNTKNTFLGSKNDIDTYLGKLATLGNYKDIKFHGILKGDGEKFCKRQIVAFKFIVSRLRSLQFCST